MNEVETLPFNEGSAAVEIVEAQRLDIARPMQAASFHMPPTFRLLEMAIERNMSPEQIQKFMDINDRAEASDLQREAREAKRAFITAMAMFKANPPRIVKDRDNKQYGSKYVSLGNLVNTTLPILSQCGLSATWDQEQSSAGIKVTCTVTHEMGHAESVSMTAPPDKSGAKNGIQEIKSTITYLRASTFESVLGLASSDANFDDDGNGHSDKAKGMPEEAFQAHIEKIRKAGTQADLQRLFGEAYRAAQAEKDTPAVQALIREKDIRKKELAQ